MKPVCWRMCQTCRDNDYRGRRYMRWDGADETPEVFLEKEAWHDKINQEMWDDYVKVSMDHQLPEVPGEGLPRPSG